MCQSKRLHSTASYTQHTHTHTHIQQQMQSERMELKKAVKEKEGGQNAGCKVKMHFCYESDCVQTISQNSTFEFSQREYVNSILNTLNNMHAYNMRDSNKHVFTHHKSKHSHLKNKLNSCTASSRARIGASVAREMALRALGCSLMGVSKVFLRNIAPARCRDQTLSVGEHLAAEFSQWRFALSV